MRLSFKNKKSRINPIEDSGKKDKKNGASCRNRTDDLLITSQLLYQLS